MILNTTVTHHLKFMLILLFRSLIKSTSDLMKDDIADDAE